MTRYKRSFYTTHDNKDLFLQEWLPEKDPKAIVLYVHGLGSHGGRMEHWAERFVKKDLAFIAYDQRGHGKSSGKRGHPTKVDLMINDVGKIVDYIRENFPETAIILYGHSMGGSIAINYVIRDSYTVDALITTSPWLKLVNPPSKVLLKIIKPLLKIAPGIRLSNGLNPEFISSDKEEVSKYSEDPLIHNKIAIGLFNSSFEAGYTALRNIYKINCPFLIMHGTGDQITSHKASEEFVMNTSSRTHLKLWEDAFHELHHEPIREEVFDYIIKWLKEHKFL